MSEGYIPKLNRHTSSSDEVETPIESSGNNTFKGDPPLHMSFRSKDYTFGDTDVVYQVASGC